MDRNEFEQLAASMLYDEINADDRRRLQIYLSKHPDERIEFEEMKNTHALLNQLEEHSASDIPLSASQIAASSRTGKSWKRWFTAAAVFLAFFLTAATQGIAFQVGEFRIAFGPAADAQTIREEVQTEFASSYLSIVEELTQAVQEVQNLSELTADRQDALDESVKLLTFLQKQDRRIVSEQWKQFTSELSLEINKRLNQMYAMTTQPIPYDPKNSY